MDFPIKHGDFPVRYVKLPEGMTLKMATTNKSSRVTDQLANLSVDHSPCWRPNGLPVTTDWRSLASLAISQKDVNLPSGELT